MKKFNNIILSILLLLSHQVFSQPGELDISFGNAGYAKVKPQNMGSIANDFAIQPDGKIIMVGRTVGDMFIARLLPDGSLDDTFGDHGKSIIPIHSLYGYETSEEAKCVLVQPDGKIILGGFYFEPFLAPKVGGYLVVRLNANGTFDPGFAGNGILTFRKSGSVNAMALQPDGKIILAAGYEYTQTLTNVFRIHSNGDLDSTFNFQTEYLNFIANSIILKTDGKIVLGGTEIGPLHSRFSISFLDTHGKLEKKLYYDILSDYSRSLQTTMQPDGKFVMAGYAGTDQNGSDSRIVVIRLDKDGFLDNSFDEDGKVILTDEGRAHSIEILKNGKIILGISVLKELAFLQLNTNGSVDSSFSNDGKSIIAVNAICREITAVHVQNDGKIVGVISCPHYDTSSAFTAVRLHGDNITGTINSDKAIMKKDAFIYPNPSSGMIHMSLPQNMDMGHYEVKIYNYLGNLIFHRYYANKPSSLSLEGLSSGIYYVLIQSETKQYKNTLVME